MKILKLLNCNLLQLRRGFAETTERQRNLMAKGLPKQRQLPGVKKIICVASGKGGVGKSTIAVNLALCFANRFGLKTGLLDADIYGPSLPKMMNLSGHQPDLDSNNLMLPIRNYNVACMSMGFLVEEKAAMVWRGLMVMSALERLLFKVAWGPLDLLVVDMPPGTGDVHLSLSQNLKLDGAVIVSTPQEVALMDARRGIEMFAKVNVPILGIVQNMSRFNCSKCGHVEHIFGEEGARNLATEMSVELLADVPLNRSLMQAGESGAPIVVSHPGLTESLVFAAACEKIVNRLGLSNLT